VAQHGQAVGEEYSVAVKVLDLERNKKQLSKEKDKAKKKKLKIERAVLKDQKRTLKKKVKALVVKQLIYEQAALMAKTGRGELAKKVIKEAVFESENKDGTSADVLALVNSIEKKFAKEKVIAHQCRLGEQGDSSREGGVEVMERKFQSLTDKALSTFNNRAERVGREIGLRDDHRGSYSRDRDEERPTKRQRPDDVLNVKWVDGGEYSSSLKGVDVPAPSSHWGKRTPLNEKAQVDRNFQGKCGVCERRGHRAHECDPKEYRVGGRSRVSPRYMFEKGYFDATGNKRN
jgi:hypothetical protein